jgi:hypothetical protein
MGRAGTLLGAVVHVLLRALVLVGGTRLRTRKLRESNSTDGHDGQPEERPASAI